MRFLLLLARTLGRTLEDLMDGMTYFEFGLWCAEYDLAPWAPLAPIDARGPEEFAAMSRGR